MAVPGGSKPLSFGFGKKPAANGTSGGSKAPFSLAKPGASSVPKKRTHALLSDDLDGDDAEGATEITGFDTSAGGAVSVDHGKKKEGPLVIAALKNDDWRLASKRRRMRSELPSRPGQNSDEKAPEGKDVVGDEEKVFGLQILKKDDQPSDEMEVEGGAERKKVDEPKVEKVEKSDDQLALEALLGHKKESTLVLEAQETRDEGDVEDTKWSVPVEDFGAALLRGMGWKEGEEVGKNKGTKPRRVLEVKSRDARLGLGAKPDALMAQGANGKPIKGKRLNAGQHNPLLLRNKETGEEVTEEEYKQRMEQGSLVASDKRREGDQEQSRDSSRRRDHESSKRRERRERDYSDDERRDRDKRRDRGYGDDARRSKESRKHRISRSRSPGHRSSKDSSRRREYDDSKESSRRRNYDDSRRSEKRDRDRRKDYDDDRYDSRHESSKHSSSSKREKYGDYDRSEKSARRREEVY